MELTISTNKEDIEKIKTKTNLSFPQVRGCFSLSGQDRKMTFDAKQLKYWNKYCPQEGNVRNIYLDDNPDNNVRKDHNQPPELLNNLLEYLMTHKKNFEDVFNDDAISLSEAPIVCYRGFLRLISSLPYFPEESVDVCCCLYRGVIYFYHLKEPEDLKSFLLKQSDWGYKFEQYMMADSPTSRPDTTGIVIQSEEFNCIFRADLNKHHLIYGAEVDGILVEDEKKVFSEFSGDKLISELNDCKFLEIKTKNEIFNERQRTTFSKFNSIRYFLQSYYGRSCGILCGFKNPRNGRVRNIKSYRIMSLPDYANGHWNADACFNFCNMFFSYVRNYFSTELKKLNIDEKNIRSAPKIEVMFERKADSHLFKKSENYPENFALIPEWYIKSFN